MALLSSHAWGVFGQLFGGTFSSGGLALTGTGVLHDRGRSTPPYKSPAYIGSFGGQRDRYIAPHVTIQAIHGGDPHSNHVREFGRHAASRMACDNKHKNYVPIEPSFE